VDIRGRNTMIKEDILEGEEGKRKKQYWRFCSDNWTYIMGGYIVDSTWISKLKGTCS